jgi:hypothetical protein
MELRIKAEYVGMDGDDVVLDVRGLEHVGLDGLDRVRAIDSRGPREMTRSEQRDFDDAMEGFARACLGRALGELVNR